MIIDEFVWKNFLKLIAQWRFQLTEEKSTNLLKLKTNWPLQKMNWLTKVPKYVAEHEFDVDKYMFSFSWNDIYEFEWKTW